MAAGLVVFGATLQALSYFQQQFMRQQREVAQQQDLRLGLEVLEQELRLAGSDSLTTTASDSVEFSANLQGLSTTVTATAAIGQTALAVEDGRGWDDRKTIVVCWAERCETLTLARDGSTASADDKAAADKSDSIRSLCLTLESCPLLQSSR